jgi:hypothetical protein
MAKEGSGFAASVWKARRSALNSAAPWPGPEVAQERVLEIQRKLHRRPMSAGISVESRMRGNSHVRFGGRPGEPDQPQG